MANEFIVRKGIISLGGVTVPLTQVNGVYSVGVDDYTVEATANSFTITLPTAVGITGKIYVIKNSGAGTITFAATEGEPIDGQSSWPLTQYDTISIQIMVVTG